MSARLKIADASVEKYTHDVFARTMMSNIRIAREFFTLYLPEGIKEKIDLDHLILQPRSYVNDIRKESIVDILYQTKIIHTEDPAYIYLLVEHQSTADEWLAFRILKYICNIMNDHLKSKKALPLVLPFVIYHGEKPYIHSTDIRDKIAAPKALVDQYFLKPFYLIDLNCISDEELKKQSWIGMVEFLLKHIHDRNMLQCIEEISDILRQMVTAGAEEMVAMMLQYALVNGDIEDDQGFFALIKHKISTAVGENMMTGLERIIERGRIEGRMEGKAEGKAEGEQMQAIRTALILLKENMTIEFISKATGLSSEKIVALVELRHEDLY